MSKKNTFKVGRSAKNGRFTSVKTAERYKNTHVVETIKKPCLLYTSPSPRDRTRSRMPSSA